MSFYVVGKRRNSVNRPPTPDAVEDQEKEPTLQEIINIKVFFLKLFLYFNVMLLSSNYWYYNGYFDYFLVEFLF